MERFIYSLCGLWFWLTRKHRTGQYAEIADTLQAAREYLWTDFATRASTRDRGTMLPHQIEALAILEQHGELVSRTSQRFGSLTECCKYVTEELVEMQKAA